jgi:hypothetical protein
MLIAGDTLRIGMLFLGYRDFKSGMGQDWDGITLWIVSNISLIPLGCLYDDGCTHFAFSI